MNKTSKKRLQAIFLSMTLALTTVFSPSVNVYAADEKSIVVEEKHEVIQTNIVPKTVKTIEVTKEPVETQMVEEIVEPTVEPTLTPTVEPTVTPLPQITETIETVEQTVEDIPANEEELMSDEDIELIALITMGEAEAESVEGKRWVIDVILNRMDSDDFPDTPRGVIYQNGQFECTWNGRLNRCEVREDICQLVREELKNRTNSEVLYFRTDHYHSFGERVGKVGNHYFSK